MPDILWAFPPPPQGSRGFCDTRIFSNMDNYSIFLINEKKKVQD